MLRIETHLIRRSLGGGEVDCGDAGFIQAWPSHCLLALVDALGHGPEAAAVARKAIEYLERHVTLPPGEILAGMHESLKGTRGAVASLGQLDLGTGTLTYAGTGNVAARVVGHGWFSFINNDGVIGYSMSRPREINAQMGPGDVFVMCSDGIRSNIAPVDIDDVLRDSAQAIASRFMTLFGKTDDDASCLVARCLR